ncbi:unnamed protein product [Angiostrongylus costaricensis]|uniref:Uncharacterized protein n=1 Tax=Angiostrongylus costaricensis TaxID=334426 RepID=A0A0R3PR48_ANGCS|nr:unnamed protein product [Angiostrongylus costaricensis]
MQPSTESTAASSKVRREPPQFRFMFSWLRIKGCRNSGVAPDPTVGGRGGDLLPGVIRSIPMLLYSVHDHQELRWSQTPPPLYSDIEKGVIFDPLRSLSSTAPSSPASPDPPPLAIQYLYPPRYESPTVCIPVGNEPTRLPPAEQNCPSSCALSALPQRPTVTVIVMGGSL